MPDEDGEEEDGMDEALCPTDCNVVTDDHLRSIFAPLPEGVKLTVVCGKAHYWYSSRTRPSKTRCIIYAQGS